MPHVYFCQIGVLKLPGERNNQVYLRTTWGTSEDNDGKAPYPQRFLGGIWILVSKWFWCTSSVENHTLNSINYSQSWRVKSKIITISLRNHQCQKMVSELQGQKIKLQGQITQITMVIPTATQIQKYTYKTPQIYLEEILTGKKGQSNILKYVVFITVKLLLRFLKKILFILRMCVCTCVHTHKQREGQRERENPKQTPCQVQR